MFDIWAIIILLIVAYEIYFYFKKDYIGKLNRRSLHRIFMNKHKILIRTLDCMLILSILFNFGAVFLTNALVIKEVPEGKEIVFVEANPEVCGTANIPCHSEEGEIIKINTLIARMWAFQILLYLWIRNRLDSMWAIWILVFLVSFVFIQTGRNFFNDFGFLVGWRVYG